MLLLLLLPHRTRSVCVHLVPARFTTGQQHNH